MSTPAPPGPVLGPCTAWIDGDDLSSCCDFECDDPAGLASFAEAASLALFEISGRQFTGVCEKTIRPCRRGCSCWGGSVASGLSTWGWMVPLPGGTIGPWWVSENGDRCGCGPTSSIKLAGYPVREITQVKIDGQVLDPAGYRLDRWRILTRLDDPGPPTIKNQWPTCQNLSLDDDEAGTFSISYLWGADVPQLAKDAACQLGCQLYVSTNGGSCALPAGVTKVVRQGVEIDRELLANWLDPTKTTGLVILDTFLHAFGGAKRRRRPAIASPDVSFGRRVGS